MNLPENYVVICETQEETNEVIDFIEFDNTKTWQFWNYVTVSKNEWNIYAAKERAEQWFDKHKNISDYKTFTFKEWKKMKEAKTPPQYWYIKITEETLDAVNKVRAKQKENNEPINSNDYAYYGKNKKHSSFGGLGVDTVKEENLLELTLKEFKSYFLEEESIFPERWSILATKENIKEISDFFVKCTNGHFCYKGTSFTNWYFHSHCNADFSIYNHKNFSYCTSYKREGFEEISIEEFRKHVLKHPNKMKPYKENSEVTYEMITTHPYFKTLSEKELWNVIDKMNWEGYCKLDGLSCTDKVNNLINKFNNKTMKLIVSINEVLEIHKIACSTWKTKIANYLTRVDSNQNISFTQSEVDEMFKAATSDQKPVLTKIFGEPVKSIEWNKIKTGSKVMLKETGKICNVSKEVDFTKEFDVVFYNTPYLISSSNKFSKESVCEKYCTFHQDSKFVLFDASQIDYIIEVIKY